MTCPTCNHTMERIHEVMVFQCPRCGTTRVEDSGTDGPSVYVPKLVSRCREFEKILVNAGMMTNVQPWRTLGIAESINLPDARPKPE